MDNNRMEAVEDKDCFPIKELNVWNSFPKFVQVLFEPLQLDASGRIRTTNLLATLTNVQLLESGFVPVVNGDPSHTADVIMDLTTESRMLLLVLDLIQILEIKRDLRRVPYRYIMANETPQVAAHPQSAIVANTPNNNKYKYNDTDLEFAFLQEANGMLAIRALFFTFTLVSSTKEKIYQAFQLNFKDAFKLRQNELTNFISSSWAPMEFLLRGKFKAENFAQSLKNHFIYPIMDQKDAICLDRRGLMELPDELLIELSKFMDVPSFLNFSVVNKRANGLLRHNEEVWKVHCRRAYQPWCTGTPRGCVKKTHSTYEKTYKAFKEF